MTPESPHPSVELRGRLIDWILLLVLPLSLASNVFLASRVVALNTFAKRLTGDGRLQVGTLVPPLKGVTPGGQRIEIDPRSREGKPLLVYVFTPTCGWCYRN